VVAAAIHQHDQSGISGLAALVRQDDLPRVSVIGCARKRLPGEDRRRERLEVITCQDAVAGMRHRGNRHHVLDVDDRQPARRVDTVERARLRLFPRGVEDGTPDNELLAALHVLAGVDDDGVARAEHDPAVDGPAEHAHTGGRRGREPTRRARDLLEHRGIRACGTGRVLRPPQ
jgi:hypothetical protein